MSADNLHVESWSFAKGNRASAPDFSIAVPDSWNIFKATEDGERVFRAYPDGVTQADIDDEGEYSMDGIFYCEMPGMTDDDTKEALRDHGINEFVRAMVRFLRDGDANPMSSAATKVRFVKGRNCYVMVSQVDTNAGISSVFGELGSSLASLQSLLGTLSGEEQPGGYDIQIVPCMPFSNNYVRLYCPNQSGKYADDAFSKACEMAQSVELADPLVCDVIANLEKCKTQKVDAQFFCDTESRLVNALGASRELERKAADQRFVREAKQIMAQGGELPSANVHMIEFFSDFADRTTGYAFDLLEAYRFQKGQGATEDDLRRMIGAIGAFMALYEANLSGSDPDDQAEIDALGNIRKPDGYEELRNLIEAECPGYKKKHDAEREEKLAEKGDSSESAQAPETEEASSEIAGGYDSWWAPFPSDREPYYGGFNQKFDHNAACWLLYQNRIFFNDDEISWDGHHHALTGMQINAAYADQIPVFIERASNYAPAFGDFMMAIEQDEGLIVPREMIHPVTQKALREGDLTGITLLNLQACAMSLMITSVAPHQYNVLVDPRVMGGIPDFLNLMGRLIWDMREYNDVEAPFSVTLFGTRNIDANVFYGDDGSLDKPVAGAATEFAATFNSRPTVTLPGSADLKGSKGTSSMESPDGSARAIDDLSQGSHAAGYEGEPRREEVKRGVENRARKEAEAKTEREREASCKAAEEKKNLVKETSDEREARIKLMIIDSVAEEKKLKNDIIDGVLANEANGRYERPLEKREVTRCFDELCDQDKLSVTWGMRWTSTYLSTGMVDERYRWHLEHVGEIPDDVKDMNGLERAKLAHEEAMHQYESIQNNYEDGKFILTGSGWEGEIVDALLEHGGGVVRDVMVANATRVLNSRGEQGPANIEIDLNRLISDKIVVEKGGLYYLWTQHGVDGEPMKDDYILVDEIEKLSNERESLSREAAGVDAASADVAKQTESVEGLESKVRSFGLFGGGSEKKKVKADLKQAKASLAELQRKLESAKAAKGKLEQCEKAIKEKVSTLERNKSKYRWY